MFPPHCNKCFKWQKFEKTLELHVFRCGHIFCRYCIQQTCPVCLRTTKSVPVTNSMPQGMAEYFTEPMKCYKHFQRILKFNIEQERLLVQHHFHKGQECLLQLHKKLSGYQKMELSLKNDLEKERERVKKCREYIAYHERRMENINYMQPPIQLQPRLRYGTSNKSPSKPSGKMGRHSQQRYLGRNSKAPTTPTLSTNNSTDSSSAILTKDSKKSKKKQFLEEPKLPSEANFDL